MKKNWETKFNSKVSSSGKEIEGDIVDSHSREGSQEVLCDAWIQVRWKYFNRQPGRVEGAEDQRQPS